MTEDRTDTPRTLLLVDDEENILSSLRRLFRKDGYRVLCASSGQEGLDILKQESAVDVIMSDQRMPQMTGTVFLRQAREISPDSIRIVLSGYTDLESVTNAINEGAVYKFLTKPWDDEILRLSIREALQHKWAMDENRMLQTMLVEVNAEFASSIERLNSELQAVRQQQTTLLAFFQQLPHPALLLAGDRLQANQAATELENLHPGSQTKVMKGIQDSTTGTPVEILLSEHHYRCTRIPLGQEAAAPCAILLTETPQ